jgi:hypothetical protein
MDLIALSCTNVVWCSLHYCIGFTCNALFNFTLCYMPEIKTRFCKVMAVPTLLYGSETWVLKQKDYSSLTLKQKDYSSLTLKQKDYSWLTAAEMVYLRSFKGCTRLECFRNEDIRQDLNVAPLISNIGSCRKRWGEHLVRMDGSGIPKIAF